MKQIEAQENGTNRADVDQKNRRINAKDTICSSSSSDNNADERCNEAKERGVEKLGVGEGIALPTTCPSCQNMTTTNMCITNIPYFKELIIMSLNCEQCGYKSNEVKAGGAIPKLGTKIILTAQHEDDLSRDVLKSDTAGIEIPELELVLDEGGLSGMYTTVEGLLDKIHIQLKDANPFQFGDSAANIHQDNEDSSFSRSSNARKRYLDILDKIKAMKTGNTFPFTLIITDPLSNSFVSPISQNHLVPAATFCEENENSRRNELYDTDQGLNVIRYERSHEQNEGLGLNDMKTENYHDG
mmetsp:Transcript_10933/g.13829  ORF Transcript_10933/g.13829 Transcript_10933/m.13829 type:complete len:299 (-) Transcript_10933:170-1066(-)